MESVTQCSYSNGGTDEMIGDAGKYLLRIQTYRHPIPKEDRKQLPCVKFALESVKVGF